MAKSSNYKFGRIAGILCLDFTNTASWIGGRQTTEHLHEVRDLLRWCAESAIITRQTALTLSDEAERDPARWSCVLTEAKELRENIYGLFFALSQGKTPLPKDLRLLNQTLDRTPVSLEVRRTKKAFSCQRKAGGTEFTQLLGPVLWSVVELLTSENIEQVKCCASDTCGWLFLDTSKNHSRRWCDMADCGSRAKAKRYYKKLSVVGGQSSVSEG
jgi:predicted RNA-binding Zn ribbon-like protein